MIWKDSYLDKGVWFPKPYLFLTAGTSLMVSYMAVVNTINAVNLMDRILYVTVVVFLMYLAVNHILLILSGNKYIKSIQKDAAYFTLTNIFKKQITFNLCEIESIKPFKISIRNKVLACFIREMSGVDLILKNGHKYRITSDMEDFENLKEHLQGKGGKDLER